MVDQTRSGRVFKGMGTLFRGEDRLGEVDYTIHVRQNFTKTEALHEGRIDLRGVPTLDIRLTGKEGLDQFALSTEDVPHLEIEDGHAAALGARGRRRIRGYVNGNQFVPGGD
jgi:hypothetical protein